MRIFLVGFMGSGKTTIGRMVAEMLGYGFNDLDDFIEQKYNSTISDLFLAEGEHHFRLMEQESLLELMQKKNLVISTGGGCPCFSDNMDLINKSGETIYLKVHRGLLYNRLVSGKINRPLIAKLNDVELMEYIMNVLPDRETFYRKAKYTIDIMHEEPGLLAEKITGYLKTRKNGFD